VGRRKEPPAQPDVLCRLDDLLAERGMTLADLAQQVDLTYANLSVLKNDRGRAIRFSTLAAICRALDCTVGELLEVPATPPTATP
jgi:putative transcriptional regulator